MTERKDVGRAVVGVLGNRVYFTPAQMTENSSQEVGRIDPLNVFAGLQKYQACNNEVGGLLDRDQSVRVLSELFKEPNDLINLARVVELQTGIEGLIDTVLNSFNLAEWKISPHIGDVTERVVFKPHIDVEVSVNKLRVLFEHTFEIEKEGDSEEITSDREVSPSEFENLRVNTNLKIFRDGEEIDWEEDEHGALPEFAIRFTEILPGNKIRLEGTEDYGDDEVLDNPEREFWSYVVTRDGNLEFKTRKKIDRKMALRKLAKEAIGPVSVLPVPEATDWNKVKSKLDKPFARKGLLYFLLPYCDMPTRDGHFYVLSEDFILPDGTKLSDQKVDAIICREQDLEL